jgi:hypothetical protein
MVIQSPLGGRNLLRAILNWTTLNNGDNIGVVGKNVAGAALLTTDTVLTHNLGRVPNGYIQTRSGGGVLRDASDGTASWTATTIKLQASVAGTYSFWVI